MNVVGKILVVLNLVFALVTGAFLTIDYATRTNWKRAYDELKRDAEVRDVSARTVFEGAARRDGENKRLQTSLDAEIQIRKDDNMKFEALLAGAKLELAEEREKAKNADLAAKQAQAAVARLLEESKGLAAAIKIREKTILEIEENNRNLRASAIADQNLAKALQTRNEYLQEQLVKLERKIATLEVGGKGGIADVTSDPNRLNPPTVFVKGQIEKVDGKDGLVEISIGSDQGLKKYNTLEVYRLSPKAEYLGTLRVVEVYNHKAVGRLIQNTFVTRKAVRMGDQVASSLERP